MPAKKDASYYRDYRARKAAETAELETELAKTADARALLAPTKKKDVPCNCELPSVEFPKGIKCWRHLIPLMSQQQRDEILTRVVKG